ncbi:MAG TPA: GNAT family N-acetyltransferase [Candidatus Nanopelagicales bacterium]
MATPPPTIAPGDPREPAVAAALRAYLTEVQDACGINGAELDAAVADVQDYVAPTGAFLVARDAEGGVVGCAALRALDATTGEVKRMWVAPAARGTGLGARLLAAIEEQAAQRGLRTLCLDTNGTLAAAVALYTSRGYVEIERYNDHSDATHFFQRQLPVAEP